MGFYVPETMKQMNKWLVQRNKVPYSAKTGRMASVTDSAQWGSYEEALFRNEYGDFDGLGFVFSNDDDLVFIDLDHCLEDGEPNAFAEEILALFPETYTEISRSEDGLHIVCRGSIPRTIKRKEIEIYAAGRYMAFTGNATSPTEPRNAQAALNTLVSRFGAVKPSEAPKMAYSFSTNTVDPEAALAVMMNSKEADRLERLFNGDCPEEYNGDQSVADFAFIGKLNYYCNGDEAAIVALWFASERSKRLKKGQAKGQRMDYIEAMIRKVKESTWNTAMVRRKKAVPIGGEIGSGSRKKVRVRVK